MYGASADAILMKLEDYIKAQIEAAKAVDYAGQREGLANIAEARLKLRRALMETLP